MALGSRDRPLALVSTMRPVPPAGRRLGPSYRAIWLNELAPLPHRGRAEHSLASHTLEIVRQLGARTSGQIGGMVIVGSGLIRRQRGILLRDVDDGREIKRSSGVMRTVGQVSGAAGGVWRGHDPVRSVAQEIGAKANRTAKSAKEITLRLSSYGRRALHVRIACQRRGYAAPPQAVEDR